MSGGCCTACGAACATSAISCTACGAFIGAIAAESATADRRGAEQAWPGRSAVGTILIGVGLVLVVAIFVFAASLAPR